MDFCVVQPMDFSSTSKKPKGLKRGRSLPTSLNSFIAKLPDAEHPCTAPAKKRRRSAKTVKELIEDSETNQNNQVTTPAASGKRKRLPSIDQSFTPGDQTPVKKARKQRSSPTSAGDFYVNWWIKQEENEKNSGRRSVGYGAFPSPPRPPRHRSSLSGRTLFPIAASPKSL